ncbi:MarR family winged helix-turn-helix transcriptional regulator [Aneurinibacillus sp. REN35]|uniref:MarR family winged helix-turn-helix transcriptional regulator n=1 Tax=Aneurinibacillus sp. REN35 TaxID=3237286 RepID=UPI003527D585
MEEKEFAAYYDRIHRALHIFHRRIAKDIAAEVETCLTTPQFIFMSLLAERGHTVGELAEFGGVKPSAVTAMVDRMVRYDMVIRERDPNDRRVVILHLSKKGEASFYHAKQRRMDIASRYFSHLTSSERTAFLQVYEKLAAITDTETYLE